MSISTYSLQYCTGVQSLCNKAIKTNTANKNQNKKVKFYLFIKLSCNKMDIYLYTVLWVNTEVSDSPTCNESVHSTLLIPPSWPKGWTVYPTPRATCTISTHRSWDWSWWHHCQRHQSMVSTINRKGGVRVTAEALENNFTCPVRRWLFNHLG